MSVSGITCTLTHLSFTSTQSTRRLHFHRPQFSAIYLNRSTKGKLKSFYTVWRDNFHKPVGIRCALDASFGDMSSDSNEVFPRINVRDPYKRLGISKEASEEEIQAARNFLMIKYAGHKPSLDAIESAHDKIIMQSFHDRRKPKLHIKKRIREVSQSRVITAITSRFVTPSTNFIIKTAILFALLGVLTVLFPTEEGPTLQVAISLIATMYFVHSRLKSWLRASLYGLGAFFFSWLVGTFLMVSVIPPLLRGPRSLEVTTSLLTYVLLWVASTYLRSFLMLDGLARPMWGSLHVEKHSFFWAWDCPDKVLVAIDCHQLGSDVTENASGFSARSLGNDISGATLFHFT